ncbi:hypothetical protein EVAR_81567_1 [Eumeta japonica]|uniref:Uncharacterized protein n=1 Tax=Eumeta variegata TaxID=151549 RepID=A0A4C1UZB1_EUMVA|nr:hypothetical protein EVAR_81567_1 [Eumeta japonica]
MTQPDRLFIGTVEGTETGPRVLTARPSGFSDPRALQQYGGVLRDQHGRNHDARTVNDQLAALEMCSILISDFDDVTRRIEILSRVSTQRWLTPHARQGILLVLYTYEKKKCVAVARIKYARVR